MRFPTTVVLDTSLRAEYQTGFDDAIVSRLAEAGTAVPGDVRDRVAAGAGSKRKGDELPLVVVADLGVDGLLCVRRLSLPVLAQDEQHFASSSSEVVCAYVLVVAASDVARLQHRRRWNDFLGDVHSELDSRPAGSGAKGPAPLFVWVRGTAGGGGGGGKALSQSTLVLQAAAATICSSRNDGNVVLRGWEAVHSVADVVERMLQLADYYGSARDFKQRIDGPSHKGKQRKCEALDFFAVYRSMLAQIPGVSERRAANIAGAIPTMDALIRLSRAGALEDVMARVVGYGEGPDAGRALGARISAALNRCYFSAHNHKELHELRRRLRNAFHRGENNDAEGDDNVADDMDQCSVDGDGESAWEASTTTSCAPSTVSRVAAPAAAAAIRPTTVSANDSLPLQDATDPDWWMHS